MGDFAYWWNSIGEGPLTPGLPPLVFSTRVTSSSDELGIKYVNEHLMSKILLISRVQLQ